MAKKIELTVKPEHAGDKPHHKGAKVIELTQKDVAENLKHQEAALEKDKARIEQIEGAAHAAEKNIDQQIKEKKAELMEAEMPAKKVVVQVKEEKQHPAKTGKWNFHPGRVIRHIGARALSDIGGFPFRLGAKIKHLIARPQQLTSTQLYKDLAYNALISPMALLTGITGAFYKPHREMFKFRDVFKDYGPEFANPTDKNAIIRNGKKALWYAGKVAAPLGGGVFALAPKFLANVGRGIKHFGHELLEGVKDSKWHRNPRKWNLKSWKFAKTKEAFSKAYSKDKKGIPVGKTIDVSHLHHKEHKKAA